MPRLNQTRRQLIGYQYKPYVQNDVSKTTNVKTMGQVLGQSFERNMMGGGLNIPGGGIMDRIRSTIDSAKSLKERTSSNLAKASQLITGEAGTALRNLIPSSDENARPGFAGEKHAILKLPNGRFGVANYMGPGTRLEKRLRRGDPPRTMSDKVAQAHDIRYGLANSQGDVAEADRKMISKLKSILKNKQDSRFNVEMGMRPIQAKLRAEQLGLVKPGRIASFGDVKEENKPLVSGNISQVEQEGFGLLPGDKLKKKILKQMLVAPKSSKKRAIGSGIGLPGSGVMQLTPKIVKILAKFVSGPLMMKLLRELRGSGLKLAGQRGMGKGASQKKLESMLHMNMLKQLNTGASRGKTMEGTTGHVVGKGIVQKLKPMAKSAAKLLLPIIVKMVQKKLGMSGSGMQAMNKILKQKGAGIQESLSRGLFKAFKWYLNKRRPAGTPPIFGSGMSGSGFFKDFAKGFMKVVKPTMKVAKTLAPLAPLIL